MKKIDVKFENYKKLKNHHFSSDDNIIILEGDNEKGKTSVITGFVEALTAKMRTIEPVTQGEKKGKNTFKFPDKDGNPLTVKVDFTNTSAKFTAVDHEGSPVTSVKKIREIVGDYNDTTIESIWTMVQSVPGRRKFLEEFILPRLSRKLQDRLREIDSQINSTDGTLYKKRGDAKSVYENYNSIIANSELSEEEKKKIGSYDEAEKGLKALKGQVDTYNTRLAENNNLDSVLLGIKTQMNTLEQSLSFLDPTTLQGAKSGLEAIFNTLSSKKHKLDPVDKLKERVKRGEEYLKELQSLENRRTVYEQNIKQRDEKKQEYEKAEKELIAMREEKENIYKQAKLPVDFHVEDDYFVMNGLPLTEEQVSESKAKLLFTELMFNAMDSRFIRLGNASAFNTERLHELQKIAEKYNKHVFIERVNEDIDDVVMTGIIQA